MKKCKICVLPETYPDIQFNEEGVCDFCLSYKEQNVLGEDKLRGILSSRKGKKYDCVVPLSGGRDSTFALYMAKRKFGLNVLAVNYDNGFSETQSLINMKKTCEQLNVDLIIIKSKRNIEKRYVKSAIKASIPFGTFWGICQFCYYGIHAIAYQIAKKNDVPFILWGNHSSERGLQNPYVGFQGFKKLLKNAAISDIIKSSHHFMMMAFYILIHRLEFYVHEPGFWKVMLNPQDFVICLKKNNRIKNISFYDYIEWNGNEIMELIKKELGWKNPADKEWRFDCKLHTFSNYKYKKAFGISQDSVGYSNMIREGKMSRTEAMEKMKQVDDIKKLKSQIESVFKELNLPKKYIDYFF